MNIYFSGIGGVGIGPLAEIALDAGYTVQGSDMNESSLTRALEARGVALSLDQTGAFLEACNEAQTIDWFVHTSALPPDHPELLLAAQLGIKTVKRDELLAHIIKDKKLKLIAISGTHGKTTTTGMMVWAFKQLGIPVSYSVGTTLSFGASGEFNPGSEYFVYECDEFDRNFLHFDPYLSLITSLGYDHPDTYPTAASYSDAFRQFVDQSQQIIMWKADNSDLRASADNGWILGDDEVFDISLAGSHNRQNATLVVKALEFLGIVDNSRAKEILQHFPGTSRRFEKLSDNLYSDYGHHPREIAATLQLAREVNEHVVLVYQPHQNVRQHEVKDQYTDCFEGAETIYWLPTYLSREDPRLAILTPEELTADISNKRDVHISDLNDDLWDAVQRNIDAGKLVLFMGAGTIDGWVRRQLAIKRTGNVLVIDSDKNFIFQVRDNNPNITNPGMITGFGGSMEESESTREGAYRELKEETNLSFEKDQLTYLKTIFQPTVRDGTSRWVTYYTLENISSEGIEVYEGQGYKKISVNADMDGFNLSPMIRQAIEAYLSKSTLGS
jgi:UDP-N-acetylmuramate--alanine ligase